MFELGGAWRHDGETRTLRHGVGRESTIGEHIDAFPIDEELLSLQSFADESRCSGDSPAFWIVRSMTEFEAVQATLIESPIGDSRRRTPHPALTPVGCIHPVPEPPVSVLFIDAHGDESSKRIIWPGNGPRAV